MDTEIPIDPVRASLTEITTWSEGLPLWQRDALRRLYSACGPSPTDLDELEYLCRKPHGLIAAEGPAIHEKLLSSSDLPSTVVSAAAVTLKSVSETKYVNALAEDQTLSFLEPGLTIVYGDNGTGKSGYSRVLKRACRARDQEEILPDAYGSAEAGEAAAAIEYSIGGVTEPKFAWTDAKAAPDALSEISVFDYRCALVHVDAANELAYTPVPLQLLEGLAAISRQMASKLRNSRTAVEEQIPDFKKNPKSHEGTVVDQFLKGLTNSTATAVARELSVLSESEKALLEQLKTDLSSDPAKKLRRVKATKTRVESLLAIVKQAEELLAPNMYEEFKQLLISTKQKQDAAKFAASKAFEKEPLPQVGSTTWKTLWEAAREFSRDSYPNAAFPNVGAGAVCVLCQQPLSETAGDRLTRFEEFVRQKTQQSAEEAKRKLDELKQRLRGAAVTREFLKDAVILLRDELERNECCAQVVRCLIKARVRIRTLCGLTTTDRALSHPKVAASVQLEELIQRAEERAATLEKVINPNQRLRQEQRLHELEDRAWLGAILDDVMNEIARLKKLAAFDAAIQDCDSTRITRKATEVSRSLVTDRIRDAFAAEVLGLGVADRRIELSQEHSSYGVSRFRVSLVRNPNASVARVLSEGEHRCVALAAFLAELVTARNRSGVIFDDPVSSLDHNYRHAVVRRLVKEAILGRQIIVFTHDIAFLMGLDEEARSNGLEPFYECITRSDEHSGICSTTPPPKAQPLPELLKNIHDRILLGESSFNSGNIGDWWDHVKLVTGRLRDAWEFAIESVISPVLRRYGNKVRAGNFRQLVVLTDDDHKDFRAGYDFCCTYSHTDAAGLNRPAPTPEDLRREIKRARDWHTNVRSRQNKA